MISKSPFIVLTAVFIGLVGTLVVVLNLASDPTAEADSIESLLPGSERGFQTAEVRTRTIAELLEDETIEPFRFQLLELAYEAASSMPLHPHIKNRSRAQEEVFRSSVELGQMRTAFRYARGIENWRRGVAYGKLAYLCVEGGKEEAGDRLIHLAEKEVERGETQQWRVDRIRVEIGRVYALLGDDEKADSCEMGLETSELGKIDSVRAGLFPDVDFEAYLHELDETLTTPNFDQARNALAVCARLFDRFYEDAGRRAQLEERVKTSWRRLPLQVRIELVLELVESAIAHTDREKALSLVNDAETLFEAVEWIAQDRIPLLGRLASFRYRAGDEEGARRQADEALSLFEKEVHTIVDVFRSETLLPLAECFMIMGRKERSRTIYELAVKQGMENPNSWPRSVDLTSASCSMARYSLEPSEEIWRDMKEILTGLALGW